LNQQAPSSLLDAIAESAEMQIADFKPQEFSNTAWSLAKLNVQAPLLLNIIAKAALVRLDDFNPQNLSNMAWAFAALNHPAPSLLDAIARTVQARVQEFDHQGLCNSAWAFAVFNMDSSNSLTDPDSPFAQTLRSIDPHSLPLQRLCQLHQFHLWCKERNVSSNWFPEELSQCCKHAFVSAEATSSIFQNDVVASLRELQQVSRVEEEALTDIGYSLDVVVNYHGNAMIGVEVDGPSHFVGQSQSLNGRTVLKQRQLRSLEGWKLVSIPYWEWNEIMTTVSGGNAAREKQIYLQNLLDGAS
jgi:RAP domain